MIRIIILFLSIAMMNCFQVSAQQQDADYLAGAVTEREGKVVFEHDYFLQGKDKATVYQNAYKWLEERVKRDDGKSRIVFEDKEKGQMVMTVNTFLVFKNTPLVLDQTEMSYYLTVICEQNKSVIKIDRIKFFYENKIMPAEDQISDKVSLNKAKTKIYAGYKKFRMKTVDYINEIFNEAEKELH